MAAITAKQVDGAIKILKILAETRKESLSVIFVTAWAEAVAGLVVNNDNDIQTLANAIVSKMVTIRAEKV